MIYFFSESNLAFYPSTLHMQYQAAGSWPEDAVQVDEQVFQEFGGLAPDGKVLGSADGMPAWVDYVQPKLTREQAISHRTAAYRAESDPLKVEADYDALLSGKKPDYKKWSEKVAEIKRRYPLS